VIGSDERTDLRVELDTGRVWSIDPRNELPVRFVNSSVDGLAASIGAYTAYASEVTEAEDERAARRLVGELRGRIGSIDAAAIADADTWWSLILEQAEEGLL
jgi:hypothetical protein